MKTNRLRSIIIGLFSTWLGVLSCPRTANAEHSTSPSGRPLATAAPVCACEDPPGKVPQKVPGKVPQKVPSKTPEKVPYSPPHKIPAVCFEPAKVLPDECKDIPAEVCLDYFKDRVKDNVLTAAKEDESDKMATFCLRHFQEQLFKD